MKYYIRGKKSIKLDQSNFIAKGGEGSIFVVGNTACKIYEDRSKMIPEAKIQELQTLSRPNILNPLDIIMDRKNIHVGFTMNRVSNTIPICQIFTNTFRTNNPNLTVDVINELVENIRETTQFIHAGKCLIVDGNELNYLVVDGDFKTAYFIDINSYQSPSFPATAIMPSIRDWSTNDFSVLTDWYSFAIIACQLFIGIHPYKGKHPKYKKGDIQKRVVDHVSIFNSKVLIPRTVRDFGYIPTNYMDWFIDLFEKGKRTLPPTTGGAIGEIKEKIIIIHSNDNFEIKILREFDEPIVSHINLFGKEIIRTQNKMYIDQDIHSLSPGVKVVFTPKDLNTIFMKVKKGTFEVRPLKGKVIKPHVNATDLVVFDNHVFLRNEGDLHELSFMEVGNNKSIASVRMTWKIAPYASQIFDGVIFQSILGTPYLTVPRQDFRQTHLSMYNTHIPELDGYRVLDAKYELGVCMVLGHKDNSYDKLIFKFQDHVRYICRVIKDVDDHSVNFVTLENGIVISISGDVMEVFSNNVSSNTIKSIKDPDIDSDMKLCKRGTSLRFFRENKLYSIKMK